MRGRRAARRRKGRRGPFIAVVVVALGVGGWFAVTSWVRANKLNVLLITVDTTRADYIGCYGSKSAETPNIDRFASGAVLFENASTCTPQTLPSHCTMMTGTYPFVHSVRRNTNARLPSSAVTLAEVLKDRGYSTAAVIASVVLQKRYGIDQGFDEYRAFAPEGDERSERRGDEICDDTLEVLRKLRDEPFFLWTHFYDPHYPYDSERFSDTDSPEAYEDEITFMDRQIGRILTELETLDLADRTLVIIVGDHGEGLNDHDEYQHGFFVYETTLHVPFIIRDPGNTTPGLRIKAQVRTIDLAPTILEILGAPPLDAVQGVSLTPLMSGKTDDLRLTSYGEAVEGYSVLRLARLRSLTVDGWKYILAPTPRLYNIADDPGETRNVIAENAERASGLRQQLSGLIATAPPPLEPESLETKLTPRDIARLGALGYVGGIPDGDEPGTSEMDKFEPTGHDPHDYPAIIEDNLRIQRLLGTKKKLESAEQRLQEMIDTLPDAPYLKSYLGLIYENRGDIDGAVVLYLQACEMNPGDSDTCVHVASLLTDRRKWEEALVPLQHVLAKIPEDANVHRIIGRALDSLERFDEAQTHLETAVKLEPTDSRNWQALGEFHNRQGRTEEAYECFLKAAQNAPKTGNSPNP